MQSTVQFGKALDELALSVASRFGLARIVDDDGNDIAPTLPSEPSRLAALRDAVATAYSEFVAENPKWTWRRPVVSVTLDPAGTGSTNIDADPARYMLDVGVAGRPASAWLLTDPNGQQIGYVVDSSSHQVATLLALEPSPGVPAKAAVRPIMGDGQGRWELIVAPKPDAAYTLAAAIALTPPDLTVGTARHLAGPAHDATLVSMACEVFARDDTNRERASRMKTERAEALARSLAADAEMVPGDLGTMMDTNTDGDDVTRADVRRAGTFTVTYGA